MVDTCRELDQYVDPPAVTDPEDVLERLGYGWTLYTRKDWDHWVISDLEQSGGCTTVSLDVPQRTVGILLSQNRLRLVREGDEVTARLLVGKSPTSTFRRLQAMSLWAEAERQTLRAEYMRHLYEQSGRTCGTFSGLWQGHKDKLLDDFAQHLAEEQRRVWGQQRNG